MKPNNIDDPSLPIGAAYEGRVFLTCEEIGYVLRRSAEEIQDMVQDVIDFLPALLDKDFWFIEIPTEFGSTYALSIAGFSALLFNAGYDVATRDFERCYSFYVSGDTSLVAKGHVRYDHNTNRDLAAIEPGAFRTTIQSS